MPFGKSKNYEYDSLTPAKKKGAARADYSTVSPHTITPSDTPENVEPFLPKASEIVEPEKIEADLPVAASEIAGENNEDSVASHHKLEKQKKRKLKTEKLLTADNWMARNGHGLTFVGIFLFTFFVFFRPYELIPGLGFLTSGALILALATIAVYIPAQLATEGNLTIFSTEVKCILVITALALVTMPIARDPAEAWATFNDTFIKAVLIFIVMVNVIRTRQRLISLIWLSFLITIYMSFSAVNLYLAGEFHTEGYRVSIELKGLFNNPNDLALHLVTMMPIIVAFGLATKNKLLRGIYFACALLFLAALLVTFSRGGFLGLIASSAVFMWKLGRDERAKYTFISAVVGGLFIALAPGNYGLRLLSIFLPGLDPVGSADARREGLITSIIVTIRNPWGIGIGNSPSFGYRNLQTHNAYTQVSSELGLLALVAYVIFIVSPLRKLGAIEQTLYASKQRNWFYFVSIGLQASLIGYMVSSFFGSVAYNWYIYYLIAYAVAFRRIFQTENKTNDKIDSGVDGEEIPEPQTA